VREYKNMIENKMENYDKLKSIIQQANPSILELKFGCEIISGKTRMMIISQNGKQAMLWHIELDEPYYNSGSTIYDKILGRSIQLADVLLVLAKTDESFYIRHDGMFFKWEKFTEGGSGHHGVESTYIQWNLKDDNLDHQSDETKQFLIDLLITPS
jgi:hypothetical protein